MYGLKPHFKDLVNSQFCLFSNLLLDILKGGSTYRGTSLLVNQFYTWCKMFTVSEGIGVTQVSTFCSASIDGKLYEVIEKELKLGDRSEAKALAFKLFFGNGNFPDDGRKAKIRKVFPVVVDLIDSFKRHLTDIEKAKYYENKKAYKNTHSGRGYLQVGSSKFSIMLQQMESHIFIDQIYTKLLDDGHSVLTIHDSFMYTDPLVEKVIRGELDKILTHGYKLI